MEVLEGEPVIVIVVYVVGGIVLRRRGSHRARRNESLDGVLGPRPAQRLLQGAAAIAPQALYAFARARVDLRLNELRAALDMHEGDPANWTRFEVLDRVEGALGELVEEVEKP